MSSDSDLIKLYSARILALAADIPLTERLAVPDATVRKRSPLCGSTVTVDIRMQDGRIAAFGQEVRACALGQASAALFARHVIGMSGTDIPAPARPAGRDAACQRAGPPAAFRRLPGAGTGARFQEPPRFDHAGGQRHARSGRSAAPQRSGQHLFGWPVPGQERLFITFGQPDIDHAPGGCPRIIIQTDDIRAEIL